MKEQMTTYLIRFQNGKEQKVTVPESWKVTFGPAARGNNATSKHTYKMPLALRFYENEKKQRAIFTDVASFRDTSIQIEEKVVRKQEKDGFMECDGVKKATKFSATVEEWVNPDRIQIQPALPDDTEMFNTIDTEEF